MRTSAPYRFGRIAAKPPLAFPGQRIGLLGGSFNPPHAGHVQISEIALKRGASVDSAPSMCITTSPSACAVRMMSSVGAHTAVTSRPLSLSTVAVIPAVSTATSWPERSRPMTPQDEMENRSKRHPDRSSPIAPRNDRTEGGPSAAERSAIEEAVKRTASDLLNADSAATALA